MVDFWQMLNSIGKLYDKNPLLMGAAELGSVLYLISNFPSQKTVKPVARPNLVKMHLDPSKINQ